jgi:hypothetical protein
MRRNAYIKRCEYKVLRCKKEYLRCLGSILNVRHGNDAIIYLTTH